MSLTDIVSDHLFNDATKEAIIDGLNKKIGKQLLILVSRL